MTTITGNKKTPAARQLIVPVLALICLAGMLLLDWAWPLAPLIVPPFNLAGLPAAGAGLALCFAARRQFKQVGANFHPFNDPHTLVTAGWFRYTRNPMYLGLVIFLAGVGILLGSLSPLGVVPAFWVIVDRRYIAYEEHRLAAVFGRAYEAYRQKTPRWL